jgi:hypothetical protein
VTRLLLSRLPRRVLEIVGHAASIAGLRRIALACVAEDASRDVYGDAGVS